MASSSFSSHLAALHMPARTDLGRCRPSLLVPLHLPDLFIRCSNRRAVRVVKASSAAPPSADPRESLERCFLAADAVRHDCTTAITCAKKREFSSYGSAGTVTVERTKLDLSTETRKSSPELATGGGGGDIGKKIFHGGGDGGDDGGDDDDYFGDFDDFDEGDDDGLFRRRFILQELFDRKFVDAVLQEWYKTMVNLPAGLRQAYEMGLVSSAQMVRFLEINARPTTARSLSRSLPQSMSRAFIGRMLADPSFLYKLLLEQATTIGCSVWWELNTRKDRIKKEWDLALLNALTVSVCNAIVVCSLAPCRSYGNTFRFDLQNTLQKLPNNLFERSYPLREFDMTKRLQSFFYKAAELCLVGLTAGMAQGGITKVLSSKKSERLSVTVPTVSTNALGYGAFLGLYANLRYQLLCGFDRAMYNYFDVLGVVLFFSTALRVLNVKVGETSRLAWLGIDVDPLVQSENVLRAYNRPTTDAANQSTPKWFISKNAIVSGLGLLGIKQGAGDSETSASKVRRKRIVRKKVSTGSA